VSTLGPLEVRYAIRVSNTTAINPLAEGVVTLGHRANSPFEDPRGRKANARFSLYQSATKKIVTLKALRRIAAGEEILVNYGAARTRMLRNESKAQGKKRAVEPELQVEDPAKRSRVEQPVVDLITPEASNKDDDSESTVAVDEDDDSESTVAVDEDDDSESTVAVAPYVRNERYPFGVPAAIIDLTLDDADSTDGSNLQTVTASDDDSN
jgi:hypothetical protein